MEHEIIGHTKKVYKIMKNPGKSFWDKVKEILIEILIIVFAVTFAAFIERTRENAKEKSEAKEFVLGLKSDIKGEINKLEENRKAVDSVRINYTGIKALTDKQADSLTKDKIKRNFNISNFYTHILNGRYDGFKSSGKIQTIENDSLRSHILQYYQQDIPLVDFSENIFNDNQKRLGDLFINRAEDDGHKPTNLLKRLTSDRGKLILQISIGYSNAITNSYNEALKDAKKIEEEIDKQYPGL